MSSGPNIDKASVRRERPESAPDETAGQMGESLGRFGYIVDRTWLAE